MSSPVIEPPAPAEQRRAWPPALRLLLGEDAVDLWNAALAPGGGRLTRLRPTGTTVQPGGAATVRYAAEVAWDGGRQTRESLTATTGARIPAGATVLDDADLAIGSILSAIDGKHPLDNSQIAGDIAAVVSALDAALVDA